MRVTRQILTSVIIFAGLLAGCAHDDDIDVRRRDPRARPGVTTGPPVTGIAAPATDDANTTRREPIPATPGTASPGGPNSPAASESGLDRNAANPPGGTGAGNVNPGGSVFGPTTRPAR